MASLTYQALLNQIEGRRYGTREEIIRKMDIFLKGGRITQDEYNDLVLRVDIIEAEK